MSPLFATAIAIVILVAVSILRTSGEVRRFPWFWVTFPITIFWAVVLLELWLGVTTSSEFGSSVYAPLEEDFSAQFLSNEQFLEMYSYSPHSGYWWLANYVGFVFSAVCSVWAWRRGRI